MTKNERSSCINVEREREEIQGSHLLLLAEKSGLIYYIFLRLCHNTRRHFYNNNSFKTYKIWNQQHLYFTGIPFLEKCVQNGASEIGFWTRSGIKKFADFFSVNGCEMVAYWFVSSSLFSRKISRKKMSGAPTSKSTNLSNPDIKGNWKSEKERRREREKFVSAELCQWGASKCGFASKIKQYTNVLSAHEMWSYKIAVEYEQFWTYILQTLGNCQKSSDMFCKFQLDQYHETPYWGNLRKNRTKMISRDDVARGRDS